MSEHVIEEIIISHFQGYISMRFQAMKAFLNMKHIPGETENKEEAINMCEAIQEMYDDGVRDGMQQGI